MGKLFLPPQFTTKLLKFMERVFLVNKISKTDRQNLAKKDTCAVTLGPDVQKERR